MHTTNFSLIQKKLLTHDVYELVYQCDSITLCNSIPGQYVLFQLAPGLNRAYSFALFDEHTFTLIIKRIPDGKGSPIICDAEIGATFSGLLPLGHFILHTEKSNKCFIGTGTGFAPLFCQCTGLSRQGVTDIAVAFIFGVRTSQDSFYSREILHLGMNFTEFSYAPYFSREDSTAASSYGGYSGYVTDWITPENITFYQEFYLCGSGAMVKEARRKLEILGVQKDKIFWEQF